MNAEGDEPEEEPGAELERLLDVEHASLAVWHACSHEAIWDTGRKLDILERTWQLGMEPQAIMLCHRWKLSAPCRKTRPELYQEMFPKLPHRTFKGEKR